MALLMGLSGPRASKAWNESQQIKAESFLTMAEHWINQTAEENARLKAEVERLIKASQGAVKYVDHTMALVRQSTEHHKEVTRLKAEVEELKSQPDPLTAYLYADTLRRDDIKTLKAHIERLTKAGDAMAAHIERNDERCYEVIPDGDIRISEWNAAKEGKPQP
jgi:predicted RNase H-like nuclease (RuvC/YqgF family)